MASIKENEHLRSGGYKRRLLLFGLFISLPLIAFTGFKAYWANRAEISMFHEGITGCRPCHQPFKPFREANCMVADCHFKDFVATTHNDSSKVRMHCTDCHPEHLGPGRTNLSGVANSLCLKCHQKVIPQLLDDFRTPEEIDNSVVPRSIFSHQSKGHQKQRCKRCHRVRHPDKREPERRMFTMGECYRCHDYDWRAFPIFNCTSCHKYHHKKARPELVGFERVDKPIDWYIER